jgi:hypothetical protein
MDVAGVSLAAGVPAGVPVAVLVAVLAAGSLVGELDAAAGVEEVGLAGDLAADGHAEAADQATGRGVAEVVDMAVVGDDGHVVPPHLPSRRCPARCHCSELVVAQPCRTLRHRLWLPLPAK